MISEYSTYSRCGRCDGHIAFGRKVFLVIMVVVLFVGCSRYVYVNPYPRIEKTQPVYPLSVTILITNQEHVSMRLQGGSCFTGLANTWNIPIGAALHKASLRACGHLFAVVKSVTSLEVETRDSLSLVFVPSIKEFRISQPINTELTLKASLLDGSQRVIYENEVEGQSQGGATCLASLISIEEAYAKSVDSAFEDAFEKLFEDMKYVVDFNEMP
jgi:hypothetical protein